MTIWNWVWGITVSAAAYWVSATVIAPGNEGWAFFALLTFNVLGNLEGRLRS